MRKQYRNTALLALCQALFTSSTSLMIAVGGLVGFALADNKALATLPISSVVVGTALATIPASLWMKRVGRRLGFITGSFFGISGALLSYVALSHHQFWLFALGTFTVGIASAFAQLYRFAAADTAEPAFRPKAISFVLAGGVIAGFIGPQLAKWTRFSFTGTEFLGSYVTVGAVWVLAIGLQSFLDIPLPKPPKVRGEGERPLRHIAGQPAFAVAVLSAMIGYGTMSLLMTATPLAMVGYQHPFENAATVIQWHVVAMFFPSFFTGGLIQRFGVLRIITLGVMLNLGAVVLAAVGVAMWNFWVALALLGVGWNFMFIGGSSLLTETYVPAERAKVQALNDFLVFGTVATASLGSGHLLYTFGWQSVLITALPGLALSLLSVSWLALRLRRVPAGV